MTASANAAPAIANVRKKRCMFILLGGRDACWSSIHGNCGKNVNGESPHKYARMERERRFLIDQFPRDASIVRVRHINDLYIDGTALRLREQTESGLPTVFKLTQKIPARANGAQQGWITSM